MFRIEQIVRLTGIPKQSLQAWERRYGPVSSGRTESNRRVFSDADLARLFLIKKCMDAGHRIGSIFHLENSELERLTGGGDGKQTSELDEVLELIKNLNRDAVTKILVDRYLLTGPTTFAIEFVLPLMRAVGDKWRAGELSIASEHMITASVRSLLGSALNTDRGRKSNLMVLFCTPEGDTHELGTLVAALVAQEAGVDVFYLGAQMPISEICATAGRIRAQAVCVGSSWKAGQEYSTWVQQLRAELPGSAGLWLGGMGFASIGRRLPAGCRYFSNLLDFEVFVRGRGALYMVAQR